MKLRSAAEYKTVDSDVVVGLQGRNGGKTLSANGKGGGGSGSGEGGNGGSSSSSSAAVIGVNCKMKKEFFRRRQIKSNKESLIGL